MGHRKSFSIKIRKFHIGENIEKNCNLYYNFPENTRNYEDSRIRMLQRGRRKCHSEKLLFLI